MTQIISLSKSWAGRLYRPSFKSRLFVKGVFSYQIDKVEKSLFVEVVGCPGIGKSTLLNYFEDQGLIEKVFFTKLWSARFKSNADIDTAYRQIIKYKTKNLDNKKEKIKYIRNTIVPKAMDKFVENEQNASIFLVDEGLFHHFKYEISENWKENETLFTKLMNRRVLIHMIARPEVIAERILKRYRETGKILPYYRNKREWEIAQYCNKAQEKRKEVMSEFEKKGIPVLSVDAEESAQTIARNIDGYIKELMIHG
ncbi:ATP-binding protein [Halomonas sp. 7T]|uniref:ATP-binding protein n=1 Tax=Halomonas sp. 7T TaxID=2893469 RepID=UPI0021DA3597|nr:ATP-binding protein [Halomonas sp. 7T]UXZ55434.1 ATP-binding protein [Halomonas sp. 7T]